MGYLEFLLILETIGMYLGALKNLCSLDGECLEQPANIAQRTWSLSFLSDICMFWMPGESVIPVWIDPNTVVPSVLVNVCQAWFSCPDKQSP